MLDQTYAGLRVLDLSTNIAGPLAAMVLGDLGADVVKVERPPIGDDTRALPPSWTDQATVFLAVNRNKRSLVLDLKSTEGREALLKLVEGADVVVESFPPGLGASLNLRFEDFRARKPSIVLCSISAFGDGEIGAKMPGYDALVQSMSGMMSFTGHPDAAPVRLAPSVLDMTTGMWAVIGIMAALARRAQSGAGEHVRSCLLDSAFALMGHQVQGYLATGILPPKLGSGAPSAAPYRVFEASDGSFMLATASDPQFVRLCGLLGLEPLLADERYARMPARLANRDSLDQLLQQRFSANSVRHWLKVLGAAGISAGPVNDLGQALAMPVTAERQLFLDPQQLSWVSGAPLMRLPIDIDASGIRRPPPTLGQHSHEVLREAGFNEMDIERLISGARVRSNHSV